MQVVPAHLSRAVAITVALLALASTIGSAPAWPRGTPSVDHTRLPQVSIAELPPEARHTVALIRAGGPFRYERDGVIFGNRERLLPPRERGYYREYTVPTPGVNHRGPRRIVAGRGGELYYTDDHYRSFRRLRE